MLDVEFFIWPNRVHLEFIDNTEVQDLERLILKEAFLIKTRCQPIYPDKCISKRVVNGYKQTGLCMFLIKKAMLVFENYVEER